MIDKNLYIVLLIKRIIHISNQLIHTSNKDYQLIHINDR